jgi:hypothetical protein
MLDPRIIFIKNPGPYACGSVQPAARHMIAGNVKSMKQEKEEPENGDVFFKFLMLGKMFAASQDEKHRRAILDSVRKSGVTLNRSDFTILDQSRIGNSTITIAKYSLDYLLDRDMTGKRVCIDGTVAIQTDEQGTTEVTLSFWNEPFRLVLDTPPSEAPLVNP